MVECECVVRIEIQELVHKIELKTVETGTELFG